MTAVAHRRYGGSEDAGNVVPTLTTASTLDERVHVMAGDKSTRARRPQQSREKNGFWKGGRVVASNGYVLIKVGYDHHLADMRGYAYEHRLVAERTLGRRLQPGEQVHHKDENKLNNDPTNLEVVAGTAEHKVRHRKHDSSRRLPGEENPSIICACGCGEELSKYDDAGRPRLYFSGHNPHPAATLDMIVSLLASGPKSRQQIADATGKTIRPVAVALSKLKRKRIAKQVARGV